ncbi:16S rRNA (cytosine(967)-C(5))-methyltransferase RsmB [Marinomonas mediterranea]|jgi:16S rRNA m(5)C-967 methyltransferase (EC 2.1.1.-)|uniref:16S rRNA (cytosine(967)-C(5))-methyltransferase n=1 Tax=Marinomonas mediterranea (strain ATCC 700492 / JCM 21426 / NBRC 103028 / MMB-1) TaxID=717774 RepID=F2JUI6_MARM1|nr:16S rRNA (cytosine(967)-C(5))-methyltransferase RsmB [Marinomonas mediterranea]ADZ89319.1 sun protein [Marinomonas mediterranea MMB-1]WCN15586.1 16S rRNA (cytosine(967)-C(5))-methyltransferase RsmB [Marinomonas mediterranea MMB-1]
MSDVQQNPPSLSAREAAVEVITQVLLQQGSLSTQLSKIQGKVDFDHHALLKEFCFGVCRHFPTLNSIALSLLAKPFEERDYDVYSTLLLGLYQLQHMSTPDHAAINESVELCRTLKKDWATKLINAVLRRYQRDSEEIISEISSQPSVAFNLPKWLVKRIKKNWPDSFESIVEASNERPPMCIRVNLDKVSRETYKSWLDEEGIVSRETLSIDSGLYIENPVPVFVLPKFESGFVSIQDEAAQLSARIINPQQGERVLDACAAPGGKTGHLLEAMPNQELTAIELEPWRLERIEDNLTRLGYQAELIVSDAGDLNNWWDKTAFNKVLLDAPCSATGVIRRNPDIKINRKPADISELVEIQSTLLDNVWQVVEEGGYLLYATCSIMPEENSEQVDRFLARTSNALEVPLNTINSGFAMNISNAKTDHGIQLLPKRDGHDGFYYCLFQKTAVKN